MEVTVQMKLYEIWNRLGRQKMHELRTRDATVLIDGKTYTVTACRYENGILTGFTAGNPWTKADRKPREREWVTVRDMDGREHDWFQWDGVLWFEYCVTDTECFGEPSDVKVSEWRYQHAGIQ